MYVCIYRTSTSAVINEKLNETLMGIGTTTQQTNQLLLNSLEIPEDMKQASNITPFYNRVGFYDRNVTDNSQNILMKQVANTGTTCTGTRVHNFKT